MGKTRVLSSAAQLGQFASLSPSKAMVKLSLLSKASEPLQLISVTFWSAALTRLLKVTPSQ